MRGKMTPGSAELQSLAKVSLGKEKADMAIVGGNLVNVYTGEILHEWSVAIKGERIAYVGNDAGHTIGPQTEIIDASGKTLIPGLIDGHTHLAWYYTLEEFLKYAVKGGTTTIITETVELSFPLGYEGIMEYLESAKDQPIKIFFTVPPMPNISPLAESRAMDVETLRKLLQHDEVLGLGEMYWSSIIKGNDRIYDLFAETLAANKVLEGHSAGAGGKRLMSYIASGVSSCHEATSVEEALERLRLGINTMIREGDIRMELPAISKIKDSGIDFRRLTLVTDGVGPKRLMKDGYMEFVVQRAIDFGFDPVVAIQMATLNVAEHFSLDNMLGGIAPGKYADIVIIPDIKTIKAMQVISSGRLIAVNGEVLVEPRKYNFSKGSFPSIQISRRINPADFIIPVDNEKKSVKVRVIDLVTDLVSREKQTDIEPIDGEIKADPDKDILKIAVITEGDQGMKSFIGLVKGFGIKKGAFASTAVWDTCAMVIVGASDEDMAEAANRVIALKGGIVVFAEGRVQAELPLTIGGIVADLPMETISQCLDDIQEKMTGLGCPLSDAHLSLTIFTSPAIPFLRISEEGLVDTKECNIVDLIIT